MINNLVAAGTVTFLIAVSFPSFGEEAKSGKSVAQVKAATSTGVVANSTASEALEIPSVKKFPSSVGEVLFSHEKHYKDREIKCIECHHQINAKKLSTPHPDYFKSSWIKCSICHSDAAKVKQNVYACSACHHTNPLDIADETLSAKVMIHKKCWNCHDPGTGAEASKGCELCHSGNKRS